MKSGEKRYAEDMNYWETTIHPSKSLGEIQEMLEDFGAMAQIVSQGQADGKIAWLIRFQYLDRSYRFVFMPLECRYPNKIASFGGKRRTNNDQARYQMGRIAVNFVKAILTAAEMNPQALFGFLELPGVSRSGIPPIAAELDLSGLVGLLPQIEMPLLGSGLEDGDES